METPMMTPGELVDKAAILHLKAEHHPDVRVREQIKQAGEHVLRDLKCLRIGLRDGRIEVALLHTKAWKVRVVEAKRMDGKSHDALCNLLCETNAALWKAEEERDRLFMLPDPTHEQLVELRDVDRGEQQLNQDRNALIDAINAQLLKEITA